MTSFRSVLSSVAAALGLLWAGGGCRVLPHRTLMHDGFVEVRTGEGIDATCRTDAYYWHAGHLNPNASGWFIDPGRAMDDPRGHTSAEPARGCGVVLLAPRPLRAGATFRIGSPDAETRLEQGGLLGTPRPYRNFAKEGVLQVDEADGNLVRGRFHLTLPRYRTTEAGPPVEVEGRFEVRRRPPPG